MTENNMPAAEAMENVDEQELASYELAFHVLPTVAEGEVATVFQNLKDIITKHGGSLTGEEEAPARIDLAYEIVKHLEGRNRKFGSAYFGWLRFKVTPAAIAEITEEVEATKELLRYLLIRLTRVEEENPFYYHEAMAEAEPRVEVVEIEDEVIEAVAEDETEEVEEPTAETEGEVVIAEKTETEKTETKDKSGEEA